MKVLVMGYGSIGKRHVNNLASMNIETYVLTSYPDERADVKFVNSTSECHDIDYAIIATPTHRHLRDLIDVSKNCPIKKVLIEKPVEVSLEKALELKRFAEENGIIVFVGYNMRFLKVFDTIKEYVEKYFSSIRLVKISAGQYLPEWRPYKDYRESYSAHKDMGGGVDLDLSHEIDYLSWIFGAPSLVFFILREKISKLDIDSTDYFKAVYKYPDFIVDVELDYMRCKERRLSVIGENKRILEADFIEKYVKVMDNFLQCSKDLFDFDNSFIDELKEFLGLSPTDKLSTLDDGINVLKFITKD